MDIKCKTRTEIAREYGVDRKTLRYMLKKAGIELSSGLVTPMEQSEIYKKLGVPNKKTTMMTR
ncbi:hypothetical protein ACFSKL_09475 [Belliella marina]|uniref:Uncharacterized protein n=1 Tax=Belliella marina TaxID=1644146 RepID=A0ABW4VMT6_9BACT